MADQTPLKLVLSGTTVVAAHIGCISDGGSDAIETTTSADRFKATTCSGASAMADQTPLKLSFPRDSQYDRQRRISDGGSDAIETDAPEAHAIPEPPWRISDGGSDAIETRVM